jgi:hypothetical protein
MLHRLHPSPYRDVKHPVSRRWLIPVLLSALVAGFVMWQALPGEPDFVANASAPAQILPDHPTAHTPTLVETRAADAAAAVSAAAMPDSIEELDPVGAGLFP